MTNLVEVVSECDLHTLENEGWSERSTEADWFVTPRRTNANEWQVVSKSPLVVESNNTSNDLDSAIDNSRVMLLLEADWDENGAVPIAEQTWTCAVNLLRRSTLAVLQQHAKMLPIPTITACTDGSIDLFWNYPSYRILLNVRPLDMGDSELYGEQTNGSFKMKVTFNPNRVELAALGCLLAPNV